MTPAEATGLPPIDVAARLQRVIEAGGYDALLLCDLTDVRWLSGFVGSNGWAVVRGNELFVGTDGRYADKARDETAASGATVIVEDQAAALHHRLTELLEGHSVTLDASTTSSALWTRLAADVDLHDAPSPIAALRAVKDVAEIARIERAAQIADAALLAVEPQLCGMSELDVRAELEYRMIRGGADDRSYDTIVASGPDHGARPHHSATRRTIRDGDTVIIDVGALVDGYHSDMTRCWVIGDANAQQREVHALVTESQQAGIDAVVAGCGARDVDAACRNVFDDAGYLDWYTHGTGHGVGLDIHEPPFHSRASSDTIQRDSVVTVEPGLYRVGFGGFRIEDLVHVTDTGPRVLTHAPKRELT